MKQHIEVTALLEQLMGGNRTVVDSLLPLVYDQLHEIASRQLYRERPGHTINATALVHEAYLKLVDQKNVNWKNRAHFFGIASLAMRRILINYAQKNVAQKRGGDKIHLTFDEEAIARESAAEELIILDEALKRLEKLNARQAKVIEYRFFGGLTQEEIAEVLDVSIPTVRRDWRLARAWLSRELNNYFAS